jgi:predicted dehydrogenase
MRFGLIGCGVAGSLRAAAIACLKWCRLAIVADVDPARARAVAERYGAAAEPDWRTLVRRKDLEAVIISTPPPLHEEMCVAALENGKHVLCEKPLARSAAECRAMVEAAERAHRLLATGFNYRFYPAIVTAKRILDSGRIGELDHVRSFAGHPGGSEFTHPWVHDPLIMGGGTLVDNGMHIVDLTRYFLGEVTDVKGFTTKHVWRFDGCEDNAFALLRSPAGKIATLQASWSEWRGYRFRIEVYGTRGCVRASYPPMLAHAVWANEPGGPARSQWHTFPILQINERVRSYRWTGRRSFMDEITAFSLEISGQQTSLASGKDGLRAVEIAHAVYDASRTGASVVLGR